MGTEYWKQFRANDSRRDGDPSGRKGAQQVADEQRRRRYYQKPGGDAEQRRQRCQRASGRHPRSCTRRYTRAEGGLNNLLCDFELCVMLADLCFVMMGVYAYHRTVVARARFMIINCQTL